jgi:hypothetical protein
VSDTVEAMQSERAVLARHLLATRQYKRWQWAEDNVVPSNARMYVVYDGLNVAGGGLTVSRVSEVVARCKIPIVFYASADTDTNGGKG